MKKHKFSKKYMLPEEIDNLILSFLLPQSINKPKYCRSKTNKNSQCPFQVSCKNSIICKIHKKNFEKKNFIEKYLKLEKIVNHKSSQVKDIERERLIKLINQRMGRKNSLQKIQFKDYIKNL